MTMGDKSSSRFPPLGDRAVVYAPDFEPIIVIEITPAIRALLEQTGEATVPLNCLLDSTVPVEPTELKYNDPSTVRLWLHYIRFGREMKPILITLDYDDAMRMRPPLPRGVEQRMHEMEYDAYKQGIADAFNKRHQDYRY